MTEAIDLSGFEGFWEMDIERSRVRDEKTGEWVPEWLDGQTIELRHHDDVQSYKVEIQIDETLRTFMGYTCAFGQEEWVPYSVVGIDGPPDHELLKPNKTLKAGTALGEPVAWVKQVYVDPRTHYRVTKNLDGTPQYVMLRRLSEDGQSLLSTVVDPDGNPTVSKFFVLVNR